DGYTITIDIANRRLDLDIPSAEMAQRLASFKRPAPRYTNSSVMAKYARLVGSAAEGAVTTA
ncbi:MAG TPA: dihydroxy-acid dehydratase, partial [Candidatus Lustribacter sp.]|nr:dihydroxy-acid dehydratase [Candidatus Lustribacter sp.]